MAAPLPRLARHCQATGWSWPLASFAVLLMAVASVWLGPIGSITTARAQRVPHPDMPAHELDSMLAPGGSTQVRFSTQTPAQVPELYHPELTRRRQALYGKDAQGRPLPARRQSLPLPFFDDFSDYRGSPVPDPVRWVPGGGALVNDRYPTRPPTIGVVSLDGTNAMGMPYSLNVLAAGPSDTLTSQPIDLSQIPPQDSGRVFLTYFLQGGNRVAELRPDNNDSIILQVRRPDGRFATVQKVRGGILEPRFDLMIYRIPSTLHTGEFAFRWINYGRQSGVFDLWSIDYVRVDVVQDTTRASLSDIRDLAFSEPLPPLHSRYRAVPRTHLSFDRPGAVSDSLRGLLSNLNAQIINFNAQLLLDYRGPGLPANTQGAVLTLPTGPANIAGTDRPLAPFELRPLVAVPDRLRAVTLPDPATGPSPADLSLLYRYALVQDPADNRVVTNDTAGGRLTLRDYYAYDDGTFERVYRVEGNRARILVRYDLLEPDTLVGIEYGLDDATFQFLNTVPFGVLVYQALAGVDGQPADIPVLFNSQVARRPDVPGQSTLIRYNLSREVILPRGPVFVGYQLGTGNENTLLLRTDINTITPGVFYFSTQVGSWSTPLQQDAPQIRPVFKCKVCPVSVRPRLGARTVGRLEVYPQPAQAGGDIALRHAPPLTELTLTTLHGQTLWRQTFGPTGHPARLTLPASLPPGMYLLTGIGVDRQPYTGKVVVAEK